jgi:hypothetical protein
VSTRGAIALISLVAACSGSSSSALAPCTPAAPPATKPAIDPTGEWKIRWDRGFADWQPPIFNGTLDIRREKDGWDASVTFQESGARYDFVSMGVDGDRVDIVFHVPRKESITDKAELRIAGWIHDGRLVGEARWGETIPWTPCGGRRVGNAVKPDPALAISGVVLNADGTPAADADVVVVAGDMHSDDRTDSSGHFTVTSPAAGESLLYAHKNGKSARLLGAFSPTKSVTLNLVEPGTIEGTFPAPAASVKVIAWLGPGKIAAVLPGIWGQFATITGDHFKFESVPAGDVEVHLGFGQTPPSTAHAFVHVDPGKTVTVSLEPKLATASVTGQVRSATRVAISTEAFLLMPDGSPEAWYPVTGGYFSFGGRTPGDRIVLVVSRGFKPRRVPVSLEAGRDHDLGDILLEPFPAK